jgi:hypothetical protein
MKRAFDAPKGLETPLHGHMLLLGCLLLFFPKNKTSLRQNYFENFEGLREVTHIRLHLVFIWFLFGLEPSWEKVSRKKLNENMFSGRQTLR